MGLGLGIVLIVLGAILTFAIAPDAIDVVNINTIGWILMGAGVLSLILGLVMNNQRANTSHREVVDRREDLDVRDRRYDDRA